MTIFYPDASVFQSDESLKGDLAVAARATEGDWLTDADYQNYKAQAARLGAFFVAYHFLEAGSSAAAQAQFCYKVVGKTPLMLDFEPITQNGVFVSKPSITQAEAFIDAYRKLGGVCHMLYFPRWYWGELGSPDLKGFRDRKMVLVSSDYTTYSDNPVAPGWQSYGGMAPMVWQYTDAGPGAVPTDWNAFRGTHPGDESPPAVTDTLREFRNLAETGTMNPVTGPYRHVVPAGNTLTLEEVAQQRNTTIAQIAAVSKHYLTDPESLAVFDAFLALDAALTAASRSHPVMPEGLVYWTTHP